MTFMCIGSMPMLMPTTNDTQRTARLRRSRDDSQSLVDSSTSTLKRSDHCNSW